MSEARPSKFLAFVDECGDHSVGPLDASFPIFVLSTVILSRQGYTDSVIPRLARLKVAFWSHEGVNLHSRDIRRGSGDFSRLQIPEIRKSMYRAINDLMSLEFTLLITLVDKRKLAAHGMEGANPYDLALQHTLCRVSHFLESEGEDTLPIIAESRGKREDAELARCFARLTAPGIDGGRPPRLRLIMRRKRDNLAGLQMADLAAYPYARWFLGHGRDDPSLAILAPHIYRKGDVSGLTILP